MPRTEEAMAFQTGVYMAVQEIPYGRVTSYGHIARLLGRPECPRQVGQALKHLAVEEEATFHTENVPWQRVVRSDGQIPPRGPGGARRHARALEAEGVAVRERGGEYWVDLRDEVGWFPEVLPSEEDEERDEDGDEGEGEMEDEREAAGTIEGENERVRRRR